jgi:hypothetical protein
MKKTIIILSLFLLSLSVKAQDTLAVVGENVLYGLVVDGDTILVSSIEEVYVLPMHKFEKKRDLRKYRRLVRNVKKVYPYAKMAKRKYDEVSENLASKETEKERKAYMNQVEKEIKEEFEGDLKKLTISQGRILIKLIDREIGESSYDLLQELKGKFSAFFWQTLARLFGHNLKSTFDAEGEDKLLNEIVNLIENGQL